MQIAGRIQCPHVVINGFSVLLQPSVDASKPEVRLTVGLLAGLNGSLVALDGLLEVGGVLGGHLHLAPAQRVVNLHFALVVGQPCALDEISFGFVEFGQVQEAQAPVVVQVVGVGDLDGGGFGDGLVEHLQRFRVVFLRTGTLDDIFGVVQDALYFLDLVLELLIDDRLFFSLLAVHFENIYSMERSQPGYYNNPSRQLIILSTMNIIRASTRFALARVLTRSAAPFSGGNWKQRDEAAEKVYISQKQKQALKKLLQKVENEEQDRESSSQDFERKLKEIMVRYRIENEALAAEISHLHRDLKE